MPCVSWTASGFPRLEIPGCAGVPDEDSTLPPREVGRFQSCQRVASSEKARKVSLMKSGGRHSIAVLLVLSVFGRSAHALLRLRRWCKLSPGRVLLPAAGVCAALAALSARPGSHAASNRGGPLGSGGSSLGAGAGTAHRRAASRSSSSSP